MGIFDTFKTNKTLEETGKWYPYSKNNDGSIPRVRLARASRSNPRYLAGLEKMQREFGDAINLDTVTEGEAYEAMRELFIDTIVLEWEHFQNEEGQEIPFTKANALTLTDDMPDLFIDWRTKANKLSNYRETELEDDAGN